MSIIAALLLLGAVPAPSTAPAPVEITAARAERQPMLKTLHAVVDPELKQPNKFVVQKLRVAGPWGYAVVDPVTPAGAPVDLGRTDYAEAARDGLMDGSTIHALLKKDGGTWHVVEWVIGPTDVAWAAWPQDHGAPYALLNLPPE